MIEERVIKLYSIFLYEKLCNYLGVATVDEDLKIVEEWLLDFFNEKYSHTYIQAKFNLFFTKKILSNRVSKKGFNLVTKRRDLGLSDADNKVFDDYVFSSLTMRETANCSRRGYGTVQKIISYIKGDKDISKLLKIRGNK